MAGAGTSKRGNYVRGIATRAAIVRAAGEVLIERGFHGASVSLIAEKAGITPSGVQHHFASKEEILLAAMDDRLSRYQTLMRTLIVDEGMDVLDAHLELMRKYTENPADTSWHIALAGASISASHPANEWFSQRYEFLRARLAYLMREGQKAGTIRSDIPPEVLGISLTGMTEGVILHWLRDPDEFDAVETMRQMMAALRPVDTTAGSAS